MPNSAYALELRSLRDLPVDQSRNAGRLLVDVLRRVDDPIASINYRLGTRDGLLHAGFVVASVDDGLACAAATRLQYTVSAIAPWMSFALAPIDEDHPLHLNEQSMWASRIRRGELDDEGIRATQSSPLARALVTIDGTLSVSLSKAPDPDVGLASDIVIASSSSTDIIAALLVSELQAESNIEITTAHGAAAHTMLQSHRAPREKIAIGAFADIFSLPARASGSVAWTTVDQDLAASGEVLELLQARPEMHRWVMGRSGVGKSTLLHHLIRSDLDDPTKCVVVIDPHGSLVDDIYLGTDEQQGPGIDLLDFGAATPPALNPLIASEGGDPSQLAHDFVAMVRSLWESSPDTFFGPVFVRQMTFAVEALVRYSAPTSISELVRFLQGDAGLLERVIDTARDANDSSISDTLAREITQLGMAGGNGSDIAISPWLISKLNHFIATAHARSIFDSRTFDVDFAQAVREHRAVLIRLPIGVLGVECTRAIANVLIQRLNAVVGKRFESHSNPQAEPVALYVDEWSTLLEQPIIQLLAEGRKYGFEVTVANQTTGQLRGVPEIAGTVGTLALFRTGPADAALLAPEFERVGADTLRRLPPYQVAIRTPDGDEAIGWTPPPVS